MEPENTQLFVPKKTSRVESPNILELGLVSKSTLQNLGIKLRVEKGAEAISHETNDEIQTDVNDHEALQDDEDIYWVACFAQLLTVNAARGRDFFKMSRPDMAYSL